MGREIKFRAWKLDGGMHKPFDLTNLVSDEYAGESWLNCGHGLHIDHRTGWDSLKIMQYTGLKDKNGKEIYEGDIVSIEHIYYEGIAQYHSKLKESFRKIGNYVCKYDEGRFVFGNGFNNLEIHNFWKWSQEKEFYYASGDFVKENDSFGYFSKEYFRFLALEGNIYENQELITEVKNG